MWILPSRARPHNIERLVKAWHETHASTTLLLWVDMDDPMLGCYSSLELPITWKLVVGERLPLSGIYNEVYRRYKESWYGFIADDVVPRTESWDIRLIEAAGLDGMAVPSGGHDPEGAPHFVLGGKLVDSIGWLSLPGLDRLYIDRVWLDIANKRGVLRRIPDIILEHCHFSNGKALFDKGYRKYRKLEDKTIYQTWRTAC